MKVSDLVARFVAANAAPEPQQAVTAEMEALRPDLNKVVKLLDYIPGTGGNANQAFYRAPDLSLLKVSFPGGWRTPPHDHGTWAAILLLSGREKNTIYKRGEGGRLKREREVVLDKGSVLLMPAGAVHVAECIGKKPALGLHVYGGNVLGLERHMWDPDTLAEFDLDWALYESFKKRATQATAAP